ncbi:hypothetical protein CSUI_006489, partial [Cystoisospora suis]
IRRSGRNRKEVFRFRCDLHATTAYCERSLEEKIKEMERLANQRSASRSQEREANNKKKEEELQRYLSSSSSLCV